MSQYMAHVRLERGEEAKERVARIREDARVTRVHHVERADLDPSGPIQVHIVLDAPTLTEATVVAAMLLHGVEVLAVSVRQLPGTAVAWADVDDELIALPEAASLLGVRPRVVEAMLDAGLLEIASCAGDSPRVRRQAVTRMRDAEV